MSRIKKLEEDYNDNRISLKELTELRNKYLALSEEEKKEVDYNSLSEEEKKEIKNKPSVERLDDNTLHLSQINANILSIKNYVSFFFWLTICSIVFYFFVIMMALT